VSRDLAEHARAIFLDALELPSEQQQGLLDERCGSDSRLRAEVESLLAHHGRAAERLPAPAMAPAAGVTAETADLDERPAQDAGRRIGRYEIRREIGIGGMGTVFEAVQDHPHRLIALKLLRFGAASSQAMKRFRHEAEILGRLRHPNIAQVYDAGTFDEGHGAQPYFAMELVKGQPLIRYAEAGELGLRDRLELFVKVCVAVQYAHHQGVIHRDLKPDNILVDDFREPKILDFGVARATDSDIQATTLRTDIGQLIGTVPYMSPEQVTGDPTALDTRSDVYSLGVVLYELVCGRLPHDLANKAIPEAVRVIREEDPTPLSSVSRAYRGDVETIVGKALEKEKERRYQTPAELAADVRHYLADEPIVARPASTFYQLRKFARRNKTLVSAAVLAFVALTLGATVATWQAVQARAEAAKSAQINKFLMGLFALANPADQFTDFTPIVGRRRILTIPELLDEASGSIETVFPEWPEVQAELHFRLGRTFWGLGRMDETQFHLQRAYELRTATLGANHPDTLAVLVSLGGWHDEFSRLDEAGPLLHKAVEGLEEAVGPTDERTLGAKIWLGAHLYNRQAFAESEEMLLDSIRVVRRELGDGHRLALIGDLWYGRMLDRMGRSEEGERHLSEALQLGRAALPSGDLITAGIAQSLAGMLRIRGRSAAAVDLLREARECYQAQGAGLSYMGMGATLSLCRALRAEGQDAESEAILKSALHDCRQTLGDTHDLTYWAIVDNVSHFRAQGRYQEALELLRETTPESLATDNVYTLTVIARYGLVLADLRRYDESLYWLKRSLDGRAEILGESHEVTLGTIRSLARVFRSKGDDEKAESLYREHLRRSRAMYGADSDHTLRAMTDLAWLIRDGGSEKLAEAEQLTRAIVDGRRRVDGEYHTRTLRAMNQLAWLLKNLEGPENLIEAERLARDATSFARGTYGDDDELTIMIADTLAVVLHMRGDNDAASVEFAAVAAAAKKKAGNRWFTMMSALQYGRCLTELGRYEQAEAVLFAVYDDGGDESAREALVDLYTVWGKPEKAAEYRAQLRETEGVKGSD
jgi:non-specific serine/threonine protein kinase/serine/threonine-protein kinase